MAQTARVNIEKMSRETLRQKKVKWKTT